MDNITSDSRYLWHMHLDLTYMHRRDEADKYAGWWEKDENILHQTLKARCFTGRLPLTSCPSLRISRFFLQLRVVDTIQLQFTRNLTETSTKSYASSDIALGRLHGLSCASTMPGTIQSRSLQSQPVWNFENLSDHGSHLCIVKNTTLRTSIEALQREAEIMWLPVHVVQRIVRTVADTLKGLHQAEIMHGSEFLNCLQPTLLAEPLPAVKAKNVGSRNLSHIYRHLRTGTLCP